MQPEGRSAVVTGGAGGLGGATIRHLVGRNAAWPSSTATVGRAKALADELGDAVAVAGDMTDDGDVQAAIAAAQELGPLSLVVNVAGGGVHAGRTVNRDLSPHPHGRLHHHHGHERHRHLQRQPPGVRGDGHQRAQRRRRARAWS